MQPRPNDEIDEPYPELRAYERQLPNGWLSYPECEARASMVRGLARRGTFRDLEILPPSLVPFAGMLERAEWLPEVVHTAALLALRDRRFPGELGADDFIAWTVQLNRDVLPDVSSLRPDEAARRLPDIWNDLHRGTPASVLSEAPNQIVLLMKHPPGLFAPFVQRWRRHGLASFLARAGAVQPDVQDAPTDLGTQITVRWG